MQSDVDANGCSYDCSGKVIRTFKLKGHQGPVNCLDHSSSNSYCGNNRTTQQSSPPSVTTSACLLSGSEDGTARLWDLREKLRASLCIKTSGDVMSVAFCPTDGLSDFSSLPSPFARDYTIYLSVGNHVYGYDLRNVSSPIWSSNVPPTIQLGESGDEINQLTFSVPLTSSTPANNSNKPGQQQHGVCNYYLAAGDDSGAIRVTDCCSDDSGGLASASKKQRILLHSNRSQQGSGGGCMVTTTVFRPYQKTPQLLATGGTNCSVLLWDVNKPRKPISTQTIASLDVGANQVCNPPMINNMTWSPSGTMLGAALGDGSYALYMVHNNKQLNTVARVVDAHSGPIASIVFPEWSSSSSSSPSAPSGVMSSSATPLSNQTNNSGKKSTNAPPLSAHDRLLATAGNDGNIVLWDLGSKICGSKAIDPKSFLVLPDDDDDDECDQKDDRAESDTANEAASGIEKMQIDDRKKQKQKRDKNGEDDDNDSDPKTLFRWFHGNKPNWMVSSRGRDSHFPSTLFVADTSNEITAYSVPLQ